MRVCWKITTVVLFLLITVGCGDKEITFHSEDGDTETSSQSDDDDDDDTAGVTQDGDEEEGGTTDGDENDGDQEEVEVFPLQWVRIPSGSFDMGCSPNDDRCFPNESPVHTVSVPSFEMTQTEVTRGQLQMEGIRATKDDQDDDAYELNCAMTIPTSAQAQEICELLGGRLPTEAQWEYAARAGTTSTFTCGDDASCLDGFAGGVDDDFEGPVRRFPPNAFGVYDMIGNVLEWVFDCYHENYEGAPTDGSAWMEGCVGDDWTTTRNSDFLTSEGLFVRVSNRDGGPPDEEWEDFFPGFRCVRDLTER